MCPPVQPPSSEIYLYWSDEQIISLLAEYTPGSHLPDNVLADLIPYQYPPSNLPEGIWYLVHSNEKKDSAYGFWKAKGEACKVYSNATISGWRTTLEYFEGITPHGQMTDWLMQEYMITQKESSDKDKTEESRSLCRVFLCSGHSSKSEMNPQDCKIITKSKNLNTNITTEKDSESESKAKGEHKVGAFPVLAEMEPNSRAPDFPELECFPTGDFLELNDLEDPESHSSSSQNSSCPSNLSEEYFGSSAFPRDIKEEKKKYLQEQHSISRYNFSTSVVPNGVVLQPAFSVTDAVAASPTSSIIEDSFIDKRVQQRTSKSPNPESKTEGTSNSNCVGAPSTSPKKTEPSGEKKAGASRTKKLKLRTYFCLASF